MAGGPRAAAILRRAGKIESGEQSLFWPPVGAIRIGPALLGSSGLSPHTPAMSITAIQSVLQQIRATAAQSGIGPQEKAAPVGGFGAELQRSLNSISGAQQHAYGQAEAFELGRPGVALNDVMVDLQKANVAFQTGIQVRNRLVAAYQEIMNLPA
jgi:flagellar hook-basal body complex protein FliE